jgi:hypothetical protein
MERTESVAQRVRQAHLDQQAQVFQDQQDQSVPLDPLEIQVHLGQKAPLALSDLLAHPDLLDHPERWDRLALRVSREAPVRRDIASSPLS